MSGFANAVVGGVGTLIRTFIRSVNYVTGVSGWSINKDGSSEFNNMTVRGTETIGNPAGPHIVLNGSIATIDVFSAAAQLAARIQANQGIVQVLGSSGAEVLMIAQGTGPGLINPVVEFIDSTGTFISQFYQNITIGTIPEIHLNGTVFFMMDVGDIIVTNYVKVWDPVAGNPTIETWHGATLLNNFINHGAGFPNLSYRKIPSPPNSVELTGTIDSGVTTAGGTQIMTLPIGYRPTTQQGFTARNFGANGPLFITIDTNGAVKLWGVWANGSIIYINGIFPLDL